MGRQWELQLLLPFSFYIDAKVLLFFELAPLAFKGAAKVGYANGFSKILTSKIKVACVCKQPFSIY